MKIIAHRGAAGYAAENTMTAFGIALEMGAHLIETDVRLTSDGVPVLVHDATLERVAGDTRQVADLTLDQLQTVQLKGGETIPSLEQALSALGRAIRFDLEIKEATALEPALAVVQRLHLVDAVLVTSFAPSDVRRAKRLCPTVKTGLIVPDKAHGKWFPQAFPTLMLLALRADAMVLHYSAYAEGMTHVMKRLNKKLYLWCGLTEEQERGTEAIYEPLAHCRADGLASIHPDTLNALINR